MQATSVLPRFLVRVVFAVVISQEFILLYSAEFIFDLGISAISMRLKLQYCRREFVMLTLYMLLECRFENVWA